MNEHGKRQVQITQIKKYLGQITHTKGLFIILLIGVALLIIAGFPSGSERDGAKAADKELDRAAYVKELEARLEKNLSSIRGASDVSVMLTLEDAGQSVYARNEKTESRAGADDTPREGTRTSDGAYVLKSDSGGGQSPLLIKSEMPRVAGALVTARGADDAEVKNALISAVRAVLGVSAHRVQVLPK